MRSNRVEAATLPILQITEYLGHPAHRLEQNLIRDSLFAEYQEWDEAGKPAMPDDTIKAWT